MLRKSNDQYQENLLAPLLADYIDKRHELVLLAEKIDWKYFEKEFLPLYSKAKRLNVSLRLMIGCLLLKEIYNFDNEKFPRIWINNPYMQYFCGEIRFQHKFPFNLNDFNCFCKLMGESGLEKIFAYSVYFMRRMH